MVRRTLVNEVERKVFFYRVLVENGYDDAGNLLPFDHSAVLGSINTLPFHTTNGRFLMTHDGDAIGCHIGRGMDRLRLFTSRRTGLPEVEHQGKLSPLNIAADQGLAESIHIRFFANNIIGSEFNFYGPRVSRLKQYFEEKAGNVHRIVNIEPLMQKDAIKRLNRIREIKLFSLRVKSSLVNRIQAAGSLHDALNAMHNICGDDEFEIVLRKQPYSRGWLSGNLIVAAKRLMGHGENVEAISQFKIRGLDEGTGKLEAVDLLNSQIVSIQKMVKQHVRGRSLSSESVFDSIETAYTQLKNEIDDAPSMNN